MCSASLLAASLIACEVAFTLCGARALPQMGAWSYSAACSAVAAIIFALLIPVPGIASHATHTPIFDLDVFGAIAYLGVIATAVAFVSWFTGVHRTRPHDRLRADQSLNWSAAGPACSEWRIEGIATLVMKKSSTGMNTPGSTIGSAALDGAAAADSSGSAAATEGDVDEFAGHVDSLPEGLVPLSERAKARDWLATHDAPPGGGGQLSDR